MVLRRLISVLDAYSIRRERIRTRLKAIRDYENDMAVAKSEGKAEAKAEVRCTIAENMRKNGFTEEQIKLALGDAYNA